MLLTEAKRSKLACSSRAMDPVACSLGGHLTLKTPRNSRPLESMNGRFFVSRTINPSSNFIGITKSYERSDSEIFFVSLLFLNLLESEISPLKDAVTSMFRESTSAQSNLKTPLKTRPSASANGRLMVSIVTPFPSKFMMTDCSGIVPAVSQSGPQKSVFFLGGAVI